jgi:hypothetical protein
VTRPSRRPARRLALALAVLLAAATAHAWTPDVFDAYCGDARFTVTRDPNVATAAWYAAQTGDPDVPGDPACAALPQVAWFESALPEALRRLAVEPFPANPAPGRLGPVRPDATGRLGVRFYVADMDGGYANVVACQRAAADQLGLLTVGAGTIDRLSRLSVPYVSLHELVHVVQGAQALERATCDGAGLPLWVTEGPADALATLHIRETFPSFTPAPVNGLGRNLLGLRPYTASLTAPDREPALTGLFSYRSSSLFRFVAERWHGGDHAIWASSMGVAAPGGRDGLAWLDAVLQDPRFGVKQPLALVFPSFLASYAGWGRADSERWPHVGEAAWRNVAFGRCTEVVLSPQRSAETVPIGIEPIAGHCVQVRVEGVPAGQVASVEVLARAADLADVDDLHLGVVELGLAPRDGGPRLCVQAELLAPLALPACVAKPFTTQRQVGPDTLHARAFQASEVLTTGAAWTDTYVLARVPARPTDAAHAHRRVKTYGVTFALQLAVATVNGASVGPVQAAGNQVAPGHHGLPMLPGAGDYAPGGLLDPSRLLFGQQGPGAAMSTMADDVGPGLFLLQLLEGADPDGDDVGRSFGVTFEDGSLAPGSLGSFPAALSGTDPDRAGLGSAIVDASQGGAPRTRVEVQGWDADHVRLTIRGPWCYADELREGQGCSVERTLEADVWLPFGDAWDLQAPYASIDAPVQALYREAFAAAVGFGPGFSSFPPAPPAAPPGPDAPDAADAPAAAGGFVCDCSCVGPAALESFAQEIARLGPAGAAQAGALVQCAMTCSVWWAACEE